MQARGNARRRAGPCPRVGCRTNQNRPSCLVRSNSGLSLARSPIDSAPDKAAIKARGLLPVLKGEALNVRWSNPSPAALRGWLFLPSNGEAKVSFCLRPPRRWCWASQGRGCASQGRGRSWPTYNANCGPLCALVSLFCVWQKSSQIANPVPELAVWSGIFCLVTALPSKCLGARYDSMSPPAWDLGERRGDPELICQRRAWLGDQAAEESDL